MKMSLMSIPRSMILATRSCGILQLRCGKVTVSCRKAPEIAGTWKQYSESEIGRIFSGGFLSISCAFRQKLVRNHWKNPKNFRPEYCFHKSAELPGTVSFRAGLFDLGCEDNFINDLNNQSTAEPKIKPPDT